MFPLQETVELLGPGALESSDQALPLPCPLIPNWIPWGHCWECSRMQFPLVTESFCLPIYKADSEGGLLSG